METPRTLIKKFSPEKRLLLNEYRKWTKEIKRRSIALGIQYPPFAVINHYIEALGSNGIALALLFYQLLGRNTPRFITTPITTINAPTPPMARTITGVGSGSGQSHP